MHVAKQVGFEKKAEAEGEGTISSNTTRHEWPEISLESLRLQNLFYFWAVSTVVSYLMYFGIGGFLHVSAQKAI